MVSKDQAIGWVIFLVCAVVIVGYTVSMVWPSEVVDLFDWDLSAQTFRLYLVVVPVLIAFVAVLAIGAWIGWTMGTTPPPRPIEEIESESTD
jgi:hypothetical protein